MYRLRILAAMAALATVPSLAFAKASTPVATECLRLAATPLDYSDVEASTKGRKIWLETCQKAYAADGNDPRVKVALARALQNRAESVPLLRAAAAQNDIEAMSALFDSYNSFDRVAGRPQLISRDEAEQALRRAAELGDRDAIWRLATILARGGPFKRDPAGARLWGERALANPPKNMRTNDVQVVVGDWLSRSDNADERKRGIEMLEALAKSGRGDAQAYLATAIRRDDAVRARTLLESALRSYPGHALAPLADMLIKGDGGPKDERRAVSLLQGRSAADAQHAKAMLGQLMLEGRLMPRDVTQAVKLLGPWSQWDYDTRLQIVRLLADYPEVQIDNARPFLYSATEAAELGEPGAMDALIALKLSANRQFSDKADGCALAERAARAGDAAAVRHLAGCRAQ